MPLYTQTTGSGPDLVMLHGWGLHSGIWNGVLPLLQPHARVITVDLPGHGRSPWAGEDTLDAMVDAVAAVVPDDAVWLGWSLGGLLAMYAASRRAANPAGLILVASSPSFVCRPDWQSAMLPELLAAFASDLVEDYRKTLDRFLALQVRGSRQATAVLKSLRAIMHTHAEPDPAGLQAGLDMLAGTDLRGVQTEIRCPVRLIAGERDTLVPLNAMQVTVQALPDARLEVMPGAGHAPFISDPEIFSRYVTEHLDVCK